MQTRVMSLAEAVTSTAVGYAVSVAATAVILPAFGFPVTTAQTFGISALYTGISLARGYLMRRLFNALEAS